MRDIYLVLERWGVWARYKPEMGYSTVAAGFRGLLPHNSTRLPSCCDEDGLIVDRAIGQLKLVRKPEEVTLIIAYYMYRIPKRAIAKKWKCSEGEIRRKIQIAESFIDGCLAMANVRLNMDPYVQKSEIEKTK